MTDTRSLISEHIRRYPRMRTRDMIKLLYQANMGPEHMTASYEYTLEKILSEANKEEHRDQPMLEPLGRFCRLSLSALDKGLRPETMAKLFCLSAGKSSLSELEKAINCAIDMMNEELLPFSPDEFWREINDFRKEGFPHVSHSDEYRIEYRPSYRLILNDFVKYIPLFIKIDKLITQRRNIRLAIDGGAAGGKTTLSGLLAELYGAEVLHIDDFFLRPEQRTEDRYNEIGGNFDRERFIRDVMHPLINNKPCVYQKFDCTKMSLSDEITLYGKGLTVIEGCYSMHPELRELYDLSVFIDIDCELQALRIAKRNPPELAKRFLTEWIPKEREYFAKMHVPSVCDIIIAAE